MCKCFLNISVNKQTTTGGVLSWEDNSGGTSWQAVITADPGPATAGNGYFCNTTSAAFSVTLPASPSLGDEVTLVDYAGTFDTNNLTVGRNSEKIQGTAADLTVSTYDYGQMYTYPNDLYYSESDDDVGFRIARWLVGKNEE